MLRICEYTSLPREVASYQPTQGWSGLSMADGTPVRWNDDLLLWILVQPVMPGQWRIRPWLEVVWARWGASC